MFRKLIALSLLASINCFATTPAPVNANNCTRCIMAHCKNVCGVQPLPACKRCIANNCGNICPPPLQNATAAVIRSLADAEINIS